GIGRYNGNAYGTAGSHLLPNIEEMPLYNQSKRDAFYYPMYNGTYQNAIKTFICPSDPTVENNGIFTFDGTPLGARSYAVNAQVFCQVYGDGLYRYYIKDPQGKRPYSEAGFMDGLSQTILVAEKFASASDGGRKGGSLWAYDVLGADSLPMHSAFAVSWSS